MKHQEDNMKRIKSKERNIKVWKLSFNMFTSFCTHSWSLIKKINLGFHVVHSKTKKKQQLLCFLLPDMTS